mmetsp:Transcript_24287/g.77984  ORF Transcript_24287/g.77984 Transcript_24287/m.77984 type:complete len:217 (+) Transcript_24287:346-996(+)
MAHWTSPPGFWHRQQVGGTICTCNTPSPLPPSSSARESCSSGAHTRLLPPGIESRQSGAGLAAAAHSAPPQAAVQRAGRPPPCGSPPCRPDRWGESKCGAECTSRSEWWLQDLARPPDRCSPAACTWPGPGSRPPRKTPPTAFCSRPRRAGARHASGNRQTQAPLQRSRSADPKPAPRRNCETRPTTRTWSPTHQTPARSCSLASPASRQRRTSAA